MSSLITAAPTAPSPSSAQTEAPSFDEALMHEQRSQEQEAKLAPHRYLEGKVFVTGGAGFFGRALIRRAMAEQWPCRFIVFSRDEEKQWKLSNKYGSSVECYIGDIRDYQALQTLLMGVDVVIHAAAMKFIPEAERNVWEAVKNNLDGTRNVIRAAAWSHVKKAVFISTDKACQPVNTYGLTKALGEKMFAEANRWREPTQFVSVRFGNVVGSTGSIIPLFQDQLKRFNRVRITDKRMTRFWLSVDEAIDNVLLALHSANDEPGSVFVPRCGAMRLPDLARLIAGEAPVDEIGVRPGEKLHEHLIQQQESVKAVSTGDYFIVRPATSRSSGQGFTYVSSSPAFWVEPERMVEMIADAETV